MRSFLVPLLLLLIPVSSFAQLGTLSDAPDPDPRIRTALDAEDWSYEVDDDGDYKLIVDFEDSDRSQLLWVRSRTYSVDGIEVREIWSPVYVNDDRKTVPPDIATWALRESWNLTVGSLASDDNGTVYFVAKIDADAPSSVLSSILRLAATTGDDLEAMKSDADDL